MLYGMLRLLPECLTALLYVPLSFIFCLFCYHGYLQVKCGPKGKGYKFKLPSHLLKMLAPALRWGLLVMKIILATQGNEIQAVLHFTTIFRVALQCSALYCMYQAVQYCTVLYCTVLYCTVLHSTTLLSLALQCETNQPQLFAL